jgi:hypothetical protein
MDHRGCVRLRIVPEQALTEREEFGSTAIGQESEATDANKAAGENVQ